MSRARTLLLLGIWVAVMPYLGFPSSWKNGLMILTGLILMYISYVMYSENRESKEAVQTFENFSENNNFYEK